jgi:hypothetical protein
MELSFTELDTIDKNNTYYNDLTPKSSAQQRTNYKQLSQTVSNDDYNNIVVVKNTQYNKAQAQTVNQPQKQRQRPIINVNKNLDNAPKKKQISYDDILSSLNMKVVNGKLQIIRGDEPPPMQRGRQLHSSSQPQHPHTQAQTYTKQNDFYNKFLQAQQQQHMSEMVEEEIELTPEQIAEQQQYHKRLMMIQYVKNQQQRQRLGQIKSKKMKFV